MYEYEIRASRVLGSFRQLFCADSEEENDDDNKHHRHPLPSEFALRPLISSREQKLSETLATASVIDSLGSMFGDIPHIEYNMTNKDFSSSNFSKIPCIVEAANEDEYTQWSLEYLVDLFGSDRRLEVAGANATVSLEDYILYTHSVSSQLDDNPALVFETLVDGEHDIFINKINIPFPFTALQGIRRGCHSKGDTADLLSCAGNNGLAFGLHRWMLIGCKHSGSNLHVDPLGTSAWNMLLSGSKLWCLFPPDIPEHDLIDAESDDYSSASKWFALVLPNLPKHIYNRRLQFVQSPGETVFVPIGWHHAVLNMDTTICATQNFARPEDYRRVCAAVYEVDSAAADTWRMNVMKTFPGLNTTSCVHCESGVAEVRIYPKLKMRPVCLDCELSRPDEYL